MSRQLLLTCLLLLPSLHYAQAITFSTDDKILVQDNIAVATSSVGAEGIVIPTEFIEDIHLNKSAKTGQSNGLRPVVYVNGALNIRLHNPYTHKKITLTQPLHQTMNGKELTGQIIITSITADEWESLVADRSNELQELVKLDCETIDRALATGPLLNDFDAYHDKVSYFLSLSPECQEVIEANYSNFLAKNKSKICTAFLNEIELLLIEGKPDDVIALLRNSERFNICSKEVQESSIYERIKAVKNRP